MKRTILTAALCTALLATACGSDKGNDGPEPTKSYPSNVPASEKIPVVAWHGVRASHAGVARFQEAEQMGITLNYSRMGTVAKACEVLDYAAQTGIKLIVECDELYKDDQRAEAVRTLMKYPALAGYFIMDEPICAQFADMNKRMTEIQAIDPAHLCYSNLFPTGGPEHYAALGVRNYTEYVQRYLRECPVTFLSFDHYPIVMADGKRAVKAEWYENLEIAAAEARNNRMNMWAFMLTVAHASYPEPILSDLRLQTYSNLAYGTQVLQCFTYWTPTVADPEAWKYRLAPIAEDGARTSTYDTVKAMLGEVQKMAWVFRGCKVDGVYHLGGTIPAATKPLAKLPEQITKLAVRDTDKALVSFFTNHGYNFMMIQNTDVNEKLTLQVAAQPHVRRIAKDGSIGLASDDPAVSTLDPGDMRLYMW